MRCCCVTASDIQNVLLAASEALDVLPLKYMNETLNTFGYRCHPLPELEVLSLMLWRQTVVALRCVRVRLPLMCVSLCRTSSSLSRGASETTFAASWTS
jgi:hypothetical protein